MKLRNLTSLALPALALIASSIAAHADDGRRATTPPLPRYQQECGACHVAYPPRLLPADAWRRLTNGLPHHFGTDASLDAVARDEITAWLVAHAGADRRTREPPPDDRITRSAWFIREHGELPPNVWKRASVGSPSNCSACHTQATQGNFDEHDVRIPR